MNAADAAFDQVTENVTVSVAPPTLTGVYNICIRGTDSQNNVGVPECFMVPVYDPSVGFVTGGGWIISRPGAYLADANLTGKANFGFVSKYVKGKSTPTGETEFQFQVASFKFNSTVYEWLVVTGAKAQYQGRGTVNGSGVYQFVLTANDGDLAVPVEPDKFRIKITDIDGSSPNYGKVVYDNQRGQSTDLNTAEPQAISGGSIVVHKTK
jgi:hypothetical protein